MMLNIILTIAFISTNSYAQTKAEEFERYYKELCTKTSSADRGNCLAKINGMLPQDPTVFAAAQAMCSQIPKLNECSPGKTLDIKDAKLVEMNDKLLIWVHKDSIIDPAAQLSSKTAICGPVTIASGVVIRGDVVISGKTKLNAEGLIDGSRGKINIANSEMRSKYNVIAEPSSNGGSAQIFISNSQVGCEKIRGQKLCLYDTSIKGSNITLNKTSLQGGVVQLPDDQKGIAIAGDEKNKIYIPYDVVVSKGNYNNKSKAMTCVKSDAVCILGKNNPMGDTQLGLIQSGAHTGAEIDQTIEETKVIDRYNSFVTKEIKTVDPLRRALFKIEKLNTLDDEIKKTRIDGTGDPVGALYPSERSVLLNYFATYLKENGNQMSEKDINDIVKSYSDIVFNPTQNGTYKIIQQFDGGNSPSFGGALLYSTANGGVLKSKTDLVLIGGKPISIK